MRVRPRIVARSVVLPTPLRPRSATLSPSAMASDTSSTTTASPYPALTPSSERRSAMTLVPQVDGLHALVGGDLARRALGEDLAAHQHRDALGEAEHEAHVVLDEEHRHVLRQGRDGAQHRDAFRRRDAGGGLVEQ